MPHTVRTGHRPRTARAPWAVAAAAVVGVLLAGCDSGPPPARRGEVYPQVEVRYDRAVRKALAEEPGSRPVSVELREVTAPEPVWDVLVATPDGTLRSVRVDAVGGRVLGDTEPAGRSAGDRARTAALLAAATVLPEDAVEKVAPETEADPRSGKVTDVRLGRGVEHRTVWSVTVATVRAAPAHTYQVDAATSDVVDSSTTTPSAPAP
jgi:uncharacterized membrane protein YkoI